MTFQLTIFDAEAEPIPADVPLQLLRDHDVIAESRTSAGGTVTFDAPIGEGDHLSVRIAPEDQAPPAG